MVGWCGLAMEGSQSGWRNGVVEGVSVMWLLSRNTTSPEKALRSTAMLRVRGLTHLEVSREWHWLWALLVRTTGRAQMDRVLDERRGCVGEVCHSLSTCSSGQLEPSGASLLRTASAHMQTRSDELMHICCRV